MAQKKSPRSTPVRFVAYTLTFHGRRGWMRHIKCSGDSREKVGVGGGNWRSYETERSWLKE
jgi:hypothetical protein